MEVSGATRKYALKSHGEWTASRYEYRYGRAVIERRILGERFSRAGVPITAGRLVGVGQENRIDKRPRIRSSYKIFSGTQRPP